MHGGFVLGYTVSRFAGLQDAAGQNKLDRGMISCPLCSAAELVPAVWLGSWQSISQPARYIYSC